MEQHDFIWMGKKLMVPVTQDETGNTIITLRPQIQLTHNYKKKNLTQVVFTEDQSRYTIGSKLELELIIGLHLSNDNLDQKLREFCESHLEKV